MLNGLLLSVMLACGEKTAEVETAKPIEAPVETVAERTEYFKSRSKDQMDAVDHDMMRENAHSTMTITKPDRQSRVTFGGPKK